MERLAALETRVRESLTLAPPEELDGMGPAARSQAMRAAVETRNLCQVARMLAAAAGMRKESRGAHYRLDHPGIDPGWRRVTRVRRGERGEMECSALTVED